MQLLNDEENDERSVARDDEQNYLSRLNKYFLIGEIASADLTELELYCILSASQ